jgi:hypothetical protein
MEKLILKLYEERRGEINIDDRKMDFKNLKKTKIV